MKRLISALLIIMTLSTILLTACSGNPGNDSGQNNDATKIRIGYMAGPTGMGMAKLIHDNGGTSGNEKYTFTKYADTNAAKADLAAGNIDVICLPTNEAAAYYNQSKNIEVLAINCLNSLYLLTDKSTTIASLSDLEGKTIYTCKNGTPRAVLEYVISATNTNATVSYTFDGKEILTPADLGSMVTAGKLPIAVMPEPIVTSSLLAIQKSGNSDIQYSIDMDLADIWDDVKSTPVTMGCVVADKEFADDHAALISSFLTDYKASIEFIGNTQNIETAANYIVETGIMAAAPAAKKALSNLGDAISYIDGTEMKSALEAFYNAIGISLPDGEFYFND